MSVEVDDHIVLRRQLKLHHVVAIGIGGLIGSGIFISPVGILSHVGSMGSSLIVWCLCAIIQIFFAMCYAELGSRIPLSGADYVYYKCVYGDGPACMRLFALWFCSTLSEVVFLDMFLQYLLKPIYNGCDAPAAVTSILYIVALAFQSAINSYSVTLVARLQIFFASAKIFALVSIIVIGVLQISAGSIGQMERPFEESSINPGAYVLAFYSGSWALSGWDFISYLVGELKHPQRDLRLGLLISISSVTVVYILVNISYACVLTKEEMLSSPAVAVTFAEKSLGNLAWVMSLFVSISVFGISLTTQMAVSRSLQMGAKNGHMPELFSMISIKLRTPMPCLIVVSIVQIFGLLWKETIIFMMELLGFQTLIFQFCSLGALVYLKKKHPVQSRNVVQVPMAVVYASLIIQCILIFVTFYIRPMASILFCSIQLALYIPLYIICVRWRNKPYLYHKVKGLINSTAQKVLMSVPEEEKDD